MKPKEIINIEKFYGIEFSIAKKNDVLSWENRNTYFKDTNGKIISLNISYNEVEDINILENLIDIENLNLSNNAIEDIACLKKFKNLKILNLSNNAIIDIKPIIDLKELRELSLNNNQTIKDFSSLENLRNLRSLTLFNNRIGDISFLKNLSYLNRLYLSNNKIMDIKVIANLKNLITLDLNENPIEDISFINGLRKLKILQLIGNSSIKNFEELEKLSFLSHLYISNCKLKNIAFLKNLKNLLFLDLSNNNDLNNCLAINEIKTLTHLFLNQTSVTDLNFFENLTNLTFLDLSDTKISDYSPLSRVYSIKKLHINSNRIENIEFIKDLILLDELYLNANKIEDLSPLINLKQLLELNLNNNHNIEDIKPLEKLTELRELHLFNNRIRDITPIEKLFKLNVLDIESNLVSDISPTYNLIKKGLPVIEFNDDYYENRIEIGDNPVNIPPLEFIRMGNETILEYFDDAKKFGTQPINECKLIFIGDGSVGKTSLMKRLVSNDFNDEESTTHGINKIAWEEICNLNGAPVKINLWDFGGQHLQHSLHQFFLTKRVVYVLVLNPRNDEKADYWLKQIENLGGESEVIIVYNWKHEKDKQASFLVNYYELKKAYPYISDPLLLSCKTNEGINDFKDKIKETIIAQPNLKDEYPLNWFKIKNSLEKLVTLERNYIAYEEYEKLCEENNYFDDQKKKNLLIRLNNIGSIVFFEEPSLIQLQVLNPDWITTFAYSIITSEITKNKKGHLNLNDLKEVFKDEKEVFSNKITKVKYKENQFDFILKLMTKYDLCQLNPFKQSEHLFPTSFKGSPENNYSEIKLKGKHYRFLFDTEFEMLIIHRFIARNIKQSASKDFWQSGIYINDIDKKTFSLIETNRHSKVINCWIKGENIRGLWEIIRNDIKDICKIYDNLSFQEQILYAKGDRLVFLSYDEMLNTLRNGKRVIEWHPTHSLKNIDVINVLEDFEDTNKIMEELNKNGITINGDVINSQIGGNKNIQNNYINKYSNNESLTTLKDILDDLHDAAKVNFEWQENFTTALTAIYNLESAKDETEEKIQVSKLKKFFNKAKEVKDWVAITLLPAEVATKGDKMLNLGKELIKNLDHIIN
jgi:internalin A